MRIDLENHKLLDFVYCCTLRKDLDEVPVEALAIEGLQESLGISYTALNHHTQKTYLDWFQARLTKLQNDPTERAWAKWYAERRAGRPLGEPETGVDVSQKTPNERKNLWWGVAAMFVLIVVEFNIFSEYGGISYFLLSDDVWYDSMILCLICEIGSWVVLNSLVFFAITIDWSSPLSEFKDKVKNLGWRIMVLLFWVVIMGCALGVVDSTLDVLMAPHDDPGCPDLVYDTFYGISVYGGMLGVALSLVFFITAMYWDSPRPITLSEFKSKLKSWFGWELWLIGPAIFGVGLVLTFVLWLFATQFWAWQLFFGVPMIVGGILSIFNNK